ncbi:hypothetical protein F5141DRAFT_961084, partial [Pisolithus sp. B1]
KSFELKLHLDASCPISAPTVRFVVDRTTQVPIHPHISSNGQVSVSSVSVVCVTLQSMFASCE